MRQGGDDARGLPDAEVLERAASAMVHVVPAGWTDLLMTVGDGAPDVFSTRTWGERPGLPRNRVRPADSDGDQDDLRNGQVAAAQQAWQRCDLRVRREPGSEVPV